MVAIGDLRYFAEIKDDHGRNICAPLMLARLIINREADYDRVREHDGGIPAATRTGGTLHMTFATEPDSITPLLEDVNNADPTRFRRYTIHIKQGVHREVRSFNVFRHCLMTSINYGNLFETISDYVAVDVTWRFSDSIAILNPPHELVTEGRGIIPDFGHNPRWERFREPENVIESMDWRVYGF